MMNRSLRSSQALRLFAVFLCLASFPAFAQGPPTTEAVRLETTPVLDGEVLADPAWKGVVPANGFRQTTPDEGRPASERTDVFVAFTDDALYFGIVCYDRSPEKIIVSDSRRDASLRDTDSIQVILDTFRDQRNGFVFGTNPAGIEYDGQVTNEG
ncbi:MAG: carbohydrate binding family 9 domain-containing protein, partial [bacterium]|nr:carbohydrate binding family 9 domain-containing protein [bacterium]